MKYYNNESGIGKGGRTDQRAGSVRMRSGESGCRGQATLGVCGRRYDKEMEDWGVGYGTNDGQGLKGDRVK